MGYNKGKRVVHLTSAHPRYDTRIFHKMCRSLQKKFNVSLVVADGKGDEKKFGIEIYDVGIAKDRIHRIFNITKKIFNKALQLDASVYHLHDPELIPVGIKLKKKGKTVIFDSHEDIPKQVLAKHYLNRFTKVLISKGYKFYEKHNLKKFDFIISATPFIRDKFLKYGLKTIDINNYPLLKEFENVSPLFNEDCICYLGLLYNTRGIKEIIKAVENIDNITLIIAGKFFSEKFKDEITSLRGWQKTDFRGFVGREEIKKIISSSFAGLVTLHPTPSYTESLPVKMFEYMGGGIPVIASDFPYWRDIVVSCECGICVNPLDHKEIAKAVEFLKKNREVAKNMGANGKKAVFEKYNWEREEEKLFTIYENLTSFTPIPF